ncbi:MAG: hypothetical protein A2283_02365 [Lentisphaerae bacterium RIFOXYA12_FULL_48_11]|nr:MAG: hypothetical protein A2283_02365 [Lentisphaerae bacterium RIFOXYA12_FULL_48_11]
MKINGRSGRVMVIMDKTESIFPGEKMRNKMLCCFITWVLILASMDAIAASNIISRPVGFVRIAISTNEQKLVSLPFKPFDSSLGRVLAGQLTGSTDEKLADVVLKWDPFLLQYLKAFKADETGDKEIDGKWFSSFEPLTESSLTLQSGEGFFVWNRQSMTQDVFLGGQVVLVATNELLFQPSLNLAGYPYSSAPGAGFHVSGLIGSISSNMGEGFWVNNTNGIETVWLETRPYADVFPPECERPAITGIIISSGETATNLSIILSILCSGEEGEKLDVFYKDVKPHEVFDPEKDWLIAATDISVKGTIEIDWEDSGSSGRKPVSKIFARYYLVGRADVDLDQDGIPDARQKFVFNSIKEKHPGSNGRTNVLGNVVLTNSSDRVIVPRVVEHVVYVDCEIGDDNYSGSLATVSESNGPKKTINGGLAVVPSGGTLIIKPGVYYENVSFCGRKVSVHFAKNTSVFKSRK